MKNIIAAFFLVIVFSCSSEDEQAENVIHQDTLTNILIDIHLAEAKVNQIRLPKDSALSYYKFLESEIFEEYNVDSARFHNSMIYYSENIKKLDNIYEVVLDSLNLLKASQEELRKDSL